jgi:transposase
MRGAVDCQPVMFHSFNLEQMIPDLHPLRAIKRRIDGELQGMRLQLEAAYAADGRPSIPPEQLIKATVLQALYSIRSERQLCEQIQYNMLYRWFLDMAPDAAAWNHSTFSKNRERFAQHDLMGRFFRSSVMRAVREQAAGLEHFSVDGTLIEAWGSIKSFRPRAAQDTDDDNDIDNDGDSNGWVDWHGQARGNATHVSRTDPEARLMRKGDGREARLAHSLHVLMDNRHGLAVDLELDQADGTAERRCALAMLERTRRRLDLPRATLGCDAGYDDGEFLLALERSGVTAHGAVKACPKQIRGAGDQARRNGWEARRGEAWQISQRRRRLIESIYGWLKTVAGLRKARFVGRWKLRWYAQASLASYNFLRLARLARSPIAQHA